MKNYVLGEVISVNIEFNNDNGEDETERLGGPWRQERDETMMTDNGWKMSGDINDLWPGSLGEVQDLRTESMLMNGSIWKQLFSTNKDKQKES